MSLTRLFVAFVPLSCLFVIGGSGLVGAYAIPLALFWIFLFLKIPTRILGFFGLRIEHRSNIVPYQAPTIIVIENHHH